MAVDAGKKNKILSHSLSVKLIILIYFFSGACSLIDQVVWVRLLKLTLGNTVYAASIVVSVFMGGLAIGAYLMGRYSDRVVNRLRLYSFLEVLITITALLVPWILRLSDGFYIYFFRAFEPSHSQLIIVQAFISAIIILVPAMLMGSTLPLLGRFITKLEEQAGPLVGKLYAFNTLGAAAGCFVAGFILIRTFGVMGSLYIAAALNILVALGSWVLSLHYEETGQRIKLTDKPVVRAKFTPRLAVLIFVFFISGVVSIGYELLWMRSIVHLLGGFTYVFSAVLTVYLLGEVIGAFIGSKFAGKVRSPGAVYGVALAILGLFGIAYMPIMIFWISGPFESINSFLSPLQSWMPGAEFTSIPLLHSFSLFFLPALSMGLGFPLALQAWAKQVHEVGCSIGTAYAADTIGAVLGGIATGFILIPQFGLQISITLLGLLAVWAATLLWIFFTQKFILLRVMAVGTAIIITFLAVQTPKDMFHQLVQVNPTRPEVKDFQLIDLKEGITTTVSVHKDPREGYLHLYSSGQSIAGDNYAERGDQKTLGHLGILLNPHAKSVLTVGFGSGETTKCLSLHELDRIDCVEIAPEVVDISLKHFANINLGENLNEKINMIYMDAKNYLHLTDRKYDLIINDSIHPRDFAENSSLYTKEYFETIKKRLSKDGLFISWIPLYDMTESIVESIIGTADNTFEHTMLLYPSPNPAPLVIFACSDEPIQFSISEIESMFEDPKINNSLNSIGVHNSKDILTYFVSDEKVLRTIINNYSLNSDYYPFVEFCTDQVVPQNELFRKYVLDNRSENVHSHINWNGFDGSEKVTYLSEYAKLYETSTNYILLSVASDNYLEKLSYSMQGLSIMPRRGALLQLRKDAQKGVFSNAVSLIIEGQLQRALSLADQMLQVYPGSATAWMIRSSVMQAKGDFERAIYAVEQAIALDSENAEVYFNAGFVYLRVGKYDKAVTYLRKSLDIDSERLSVLKLTSGLMLRDPESSYYSPEEALKLIAKANELTGGNDVEVLNILASAYYANQKTDQAIKTLEKAIEVADVKNSDMLSMLQSKLEQYKTGL
ncbi:MAG: fused MFS/spermidine synthase [Phycisphaerae bacterium]|jgi:spermidine synthase